MDTSLSRPESTPGHESGILQGRQRTLALLSSSRILCSLGLQLCEIIVGRRLGGGSDSVWPRGVYAMLARDNWKGKPSRSLAKPRALDSWSPVSSPASGVGDVGEFGEARRTYTARCRTKSQSVSSRARQQKRGSFSCINEVVLQAKLQ